VFFGSALCLGTFIVYFVFNILVKSSRIFGKAKYKFDKAAYEIVNYTQMLPHYLVKLKIDNKFVLGHLQLQLDKFSQHEIHFFHR